MAGIYIHIPFCKKACHYCDFHFSTNTRYQQQMVNAIMQELENRKHFFDNTETVQTIYFGGGTPSILSISQIQAILQTIETHYVLAKNLEITLEANPDDLTEANIVALSQTPINRLSIGVQSFFDEELKMMNRAHSSVQVRESLAIATQFFKNITIDLMYGIPGLTMEKWRQNIQLALQFQISHISSYALTVEEHTALHHLIKTQKYPPLNDEVAHAQFEELVSTLQQHGFEHYELSNFGKPAYFSKHNTAYWQGISYLGVGPSAHSFKGDKRYWNVANNHLYIKAIQNRTNFTTFEVLSEQDRFNEMLMTGLRTMWGVNLQTITQQFGLVVTTQLLQNIEKYTAKHWMFRDQDTLTITQQGKFFTDGILADLFWVD